MKCKRKSLGAKRKAKGSSKDMYAKGGIMSYRKGGKMSSKENVPTKPELWKKAVSEAKKKYDVYPSAYANGFAAKRYKEMGGSWKKG